MNETWGECNFKCTFTNRFNRYLTFTVKACTFFDTSVRVGLCKKIVLAATF